MMIIRMNDQMTTPAHILKTHKKIKLITIAIRAEHEIIIQVFLRSLIAF